MKIALITYTIINFSINYNVSGNIMNSNFFMIYNIISVIFKYIILFLTIHLNAKTKSVCLNIKMNRNYKRCF